MLHRLSTPLAFPLLPQRLAGLAELASNLSWSWNREARSLFRSIDEQLWMRCRHDPLKLLAQVGAERLAQCAASPDFIAGYDAVMRWFAAEKSTEHTWF